MPDVLKPVAIIQHPDNHVVGYVSAQLNAPTSSLRKHDLDGFRKMAQINFGTYNYFK